MTRLSMNNRLSQGYAAALRAIRPNRGSIARGTVAATSARDVWMNAQYAPTSPPLPSPPLPPPRPPKPFSPAAPLIFSP